MELSKRNRELTSDLESERNKVRLLSKKMQEMEREVCVIIFVWYITQAFAFSCLVLPDFKPNGTRYKSINYGISNYWST